jgi:hypothetical protein
VLALAERYGGGLDHFDVWVLFAGAHPLGMRAFLKRRRKELAKERTVVLNVDDGDGVRYSRREGLLFGSRSHVQLRELCEEIAEDSEEFEAESFVYRSTPNPYPSITTSPELCAELMERLDAAIGPELSEQPVPSR